MNIDYYAPNTTHHFRMWAAQVIHIQYPTVEVVAVHTEEPPRDGHIYVYTDDEGVEVHYKDFPRIGELPEMYLNPPKWIEDARYGVG